MDADYFPSSPAVASSTVAKSHRKQIKTGPVNTSWSVDDHVLALRARMKPLRVLGEDLVKAAIRALNIMWLDTELSASLPDLAVDLQGTEARLRAWRHFSARAGVDEALGWALSWYEVMDLDLLGRATERLILDREAGIHPVEAGTCLRDRQVRRDLLLHKGQ